MSALLYISEIEFATPAYDESIKLRYDVLRKPLGLEFSVEELSNEYNSYHLACYEMTHQEMLGILVLKPVNDTIVKMRQVAIRQDQQSQGIGSALIAESERFAKSKQYMVIELHARIEAVPFYLKNGYTPIGTEFLEIGIPHMAMKKEISL